MVSALDFIVSAVMMFIGSTVLSTVGFGIGMSTTPVLLLILDPQSVVVMVNTVSLGLFVLIIYQARGDLPTREMIPITIAGLLGVPFGVFILSSANESALRIAITGVIIALTIAVAFDVRGPIPKSNIVGAPIGFVVGVLLTALGIGGPLLALFLLTREWPRQTIRVSLSFYFLVIEFTGVVGFGVAGLFTIDRIKLILVATVPVLLGFALATVLLRHMNERIFQRAVVIVIISTSIAVIGRELVSL